VRKLNLSKQIAKDLKELQPKQCKQVVIKMFELAADPRPADSVQLDKSTFRTDIGEYRIVYEFDDTEVRYLVVGKRNDDEVYKRLVRQR
jgi:mRNA interferase RelE/StbE